MLNAEREITMKAKSKYYKGNAKAKRNGKGKTDKLLKGGVILMVALMLFAKANEPRIVGYTYDTGSTVWEMATRCCPNGLDAQEVAREIERLNGIENSVVYESVQYKVPIYE